MTNEELIAVALAAGAAAYFRPNNWAQERPEAVAYLELVEMLMVDYRGVDARMMDVAPGSHERRAALAQQLGNSGAAESRAVLSRSRRLLRLILERVPHAIGAAFLDEDAVRAALSGAAGLGEHGATAAHAVA